MHLCVFVARCALQQQSVRMPGTVFCRQILAYCEIFENPVQVAFAIMRVYSSAIGIVPVMILCSFVLTHHFHHSNPKLTHLLFSRLNCAFTCTSFSSSLSEKFSAMNSY